MVAKPEVGDYSRAQCVHSEPRGWRRMGSGIAWLGRVPADRGEPWPEGWRGCGVGACAGRCQVHPESPGGLGRAPLVSRMAGSARVWKEPPGGVWAARVGLLPGEAGGQDQPRWCSARAGLSPGACVPVRAPDN